MLKGQKMAATALVGDQRVKETKRAKTAAAAATMADKKKKERDDFADTLCNECLKKSHLAFTTDLGIFLSAASSGKSYAPIPDSSHLQRKGRIKARRQANLVAAKN